MVLYFYPKDDTPGCTVEACELRDAFPRFEQSDAVILGVSPDDVASHQKFKKKFELPFTLLADTDHEIAESYGVWVEKTMYGKNVHGRAAGHLRHRQDGQGGQGLPESDAGRACGGGG